MLEKGEPADLSVDQIIEKMQRASDPQKVYANAKSYYMKQKLTSDNINGSDESVSEIFWKAPGSLKQISYRNGEIINIILTKDNRFWYINPKTKRAREIKGKDAQLVKAFSDIATPGQNYKMIFHTVTIDQIFDPDRRKTMYRLICRVENPEIAPYVFYIDPKTWLTDRCETILYGADGSKRHYIADSDEYEMVDGIRLPKKTQISVDGKKDIAETVVFTLNPEIPEKTFELEKPWNH